MSNQIDNERAKLTAGCLNSIAAGIITTGIVALLIAVVFGVTHVPVWLVMVSSAV